MCCCFPKKKIQILVLSRSNEWRSKRILCYPRICKSMIKSKGKTAKAFYSKISVLYLPGLRYHTYAADEIVIITTAPPPVTEITQNHKGSVPCLTSSCLENLKCIFWYIWLSSANYSDAIIKEHHILRINLVVTRMLLICSIFLQILLTEKS